MAYPKAYEPQQGYMYQILAWDNYNREYDSLDYATDKADLNHLMTEYRLVYGAGHRFKVIRLPKKYHKPLNLIEA